MSTAAPTTTTPTDPAPRVTSRYATLLQLVVVAILLATIGWVGVQVFATDTTPPAQPTTAGQVDEAAETARLVARGLIPAATLQPLRGQQADEAAETARLVARGLIPAATLQPTRGQQADTARLVARALAETLRRTGDEAVTQSLIGRGLVPEGTRP